MSKIVTFEQAKQLNDLGYTERVEYAYLLHQKSGNHKLYLYSPFGRMDYNQNNNRDNSNKIAIHYSAPSTADALDWLREEKGIECYVDVIYSVLGKKAKYLGKILSESGLIIQKKTDLFDTHPLASSALLTAVLNYLIEKEK